MKLLSLKEIVLVGFLSLVANSPVLGSVIEYHPRVQYVKEGPEVLHDFRIIVENNDNLTNISRDLNEICWPYFKVTPKVIYERNKDRIKDPNLIYPGQEFEFSFTNPIQISGKQII